MRGSDSLVRAVALMVAPAAAGLTPAVMAGNEALTLRVNHAVGVPGGRVAVILSTYESRPIGEGQIVIESSPAGAGSGSAAATVVQSDIVSNDPQIQTVSTDNLLAEPQTISLEFTSPDVLVNANDGPMAVFHFTLDPSLTPGSKFNLDLDLSSTELIDAFGQQILIKPKPGFLMIRDPADPVSFELGGDRVKPGATAMLAVEIKERLLFSRATVVIEYDPSIAAGDPVVVMNPVHGNATAVTDLSTPGRIRIDVTSPDAGWNQVPGDLIEISLPTSPDAPGGTSWPVSFAVAETAFFDETGEEVFSQLEDGTIEIRATDEVRDLRMRRKSAGSLELTWTTPCDSAASFSVYRGDLSVGYESIRPDPQSCALTGTSATVQPEEFAGEFFLVVPVVSAHEGSYGAGAKGAAREPAADACFPRADANTVCSP